MCLDVCSLITVFINALACENDFSEGLFWPNSRQDLLVTQSCSLLHLSFRSGVNIGRQCESDGSWSPVDLRNCTMFIGSQPVVIVYFTVSFNNTDAMTSVNIVDKVSDHYLMRIIVLNNITTKSRNPVTILHYMNIEHQDMKL